MNKVPDRVIFLKPNQILIGIIVVLIGVFSLLRNYFSFNFGMLMILVTGFALLLLYRQKKAVWALFAGGYLTYIGSLQILSWVGLALRAHTFAGMFFVVPGIIFMVLYFDKNKRGLLIPSCMLLWLGSYFIITSILTLGWRAAFGMLIMCLGGSFCTAYSIGRSHMSRWVRNFGGLMLLAGGLLFGGVISPIGGIARFASYTLIAVGILIIIKSIANKPRE